MTLEWAPRAVQLNQKWITWQDFPLILLESKSLDQEYIMAEPFDIKETMLNFLMYQNHWTRYWLG